LPGLAAPAQRRGSLRACRETAAPARPWPGPEHRHQATRPRRTSSGTPCCASWSASRRITRI